MAKHAFRVAIETGLGREDFAKLFSPDVVLWAPMLTKPVTGVSQVLDVVGHAAKLAGLIHYTTEVRDTRQTLLLWKGQAGGFDLEAATILVDGDDGLIREMRVLMRPWPVVTIFRNAMYETLSSVIPEEYWALGPKPAETGRSRTFTPIALRPIEMASNITLHSPTLAKAVHGKADVEAAVALAHEVQSPSSYTSIVATPELLIEVFDCDADGYPMEGVWIQKLNERGQIYDLTVMLRPYPAVTLLRNLTHDLAKKNGLLGDDYWELPASA